MDKSEPSAQLPAQPPTQPPTQLPLPELPSQDGAQVIALPQAASRPSPKPDLDKETHSQTARKRPALWYALYFPQLQELTEKKRQQALQQLAGQAHNISATVSYHDCALVAEVRSSLKYFGGLQALHETLQEPLRKCLQAILLEHAPCEQSSADVLHSEYGYAATPTVTGSLLLARAGHNSAVYQQDNLRSALGHLPYEVLQLHKEQNRRLYNMGVRQLKDLWRLPMDGLRKRFGSELVTLLNKALGKSPEPTRNYLPPPAFHTSYDLPYGVENLERLLPVADEMLAQLNDFLRRRDLVTDLLQFKLQHENRQATVVRLGLRQASRSREHLLLLLQTHFANLSIPAPVSALKLDVLQFDAHEPDSETLPGQRGKSSNNNLDLFMEQLRARLGVQPVRTLNTVAEHCPEYACQLEEYASDALENKIPSQHKQSASTQVQRQIKRETQKQVQQVTEQPRPVWLLAEPKLLNLHNKRLYHRRSISLVSGPERIETRWWSGEDIGRDYYIAREAGGSRLWIFRDRNGERHWYLHGVFA